MTGSDVRLAKPGSWPSLWERLACDLPHRPRIVAPGERIAATGRPIATLVFPTGAILVLARQNVYDPHPLVSGIVGREGLVGWPRLMGEATWQQDVLAIVGGDAVEVSADAFVAAARERPDLTAQVLRYVHNYGLQQTQNTIANLGHSLERRLARWLTMIHDRVDSDDLRLTHDLLAMVLNVRRASVTDALHVLEGERLLRCTRGVVTVRDRAALQAAAGYSYGFAENDYNAAIGPFGRSSAAAELAE